jgi:ATP-binding cassette, subfamily C, bacterial LapB
MTGSGRSADSAGNRPVQEIFALLERHFPGSHAVGLDPSEAWDLGVPGTPEADLKRIARLWQTQGNLGANAPPVAGGDVLQQTDPLGPAALAMSAARLGLRVICEERGVSTLRAADCPAIVLLSDGSSRLIVGLEPPGSARLLSVGREDVVPLRALDAAGSGTIIRVLPARETHSAEASAGSPKTAMSGPKVVLSHLMEAARDQRSGLRQLVIASLLINLFGMTLPLFSMAVFDRIIPHSAMETLWALALGVTATLLLEFCLRHARLKLFDAVGQATSHTLQGQAMGRLLHAPASGLPGRSGAAVQPLQELDNLSMMVPQLIVSLVVDIPFFILLMVLIASIGGPVVFAPLVGTLALLVLHGLAHVMAHASIAEQMAFTRKLQQIAIDAIAAQERIRLTGAARSMLGQWEHAVDEGGFAAHKARYWHGLAAQGSAVIMQLVVVATIVLGVFLIEASAMTVGALSAAILLVNRAMTPISIATGMAFRLVQMLQSSSQLAVLLSARVESGGDGSVAGPGDVAGAIDLQQVVFRHADDPRAALERITFSIRPGEKVGIIGKTGCGKSTLLRLIARLHQPAEGRILLDQRDLRQFDPAAVRRAIGFMPQETALIDGTLDENLTLGLDHVDRQLFGRIVAVAGVEAFASRHPEGYSLKVGPGGQRLSGGERQCVSLARALMGQPAVIMLDEPTSAMDNTLEERVLVELKRHVGDRGLLLATHRLQALDLVDRIIWLDEGRIVADGPKAEVFARFGLVQAPPVHRAASG